MPAIYDRKVRWRGEILDEAERDPAFAREEVNDLEDYGVSEADVASGRNGPLHSP